MLNENKINLIPVSFRKLWLILAQMWNLSLTFSTDTESGLNLSLLWGKIPDRLLHSVYFLIYLFIYQFMVSKFNSAYHKKVILKMHQFIGSGCILTTVVSSCTTHRFRVNSFPLTISWFQLKCTATKMLNTHKPMNYATIRMK